MKKNQPNRIYLLTENPDKHRTGQIDRSGQVNLSSLDRSISSMCGSGFMYWLCDRGIVFFG